MSSCSSGGSAANNTKPAGNSSDGPRRRLAATHIKTARYAAVSTPSQSSGSRLQLIGKYSTAHNLSRRLLNTGRMLNFINNGPPDLRSA